MKAFSYLTLAIIFVFITMHIYYSNATTPRGPEEILSNLSIQDRLFNITENTIPYTNLYAEEPTLTNVMFNVVHGMFYGIVVEMNTLIPVSVHIASGQYSSLLFKLILAYVCLYLLFLIPIILKASVALYFFIKEKKKLKEKWYH